MKTNKSYCTKHQLFHGEKYGSCKKQGQVSNKFNTGSVEPDKDEEPFIRKMNKHESKIFREGIAAGRAMQKVDDEAQVRSLEDRIAEIERRLDANGIYV
jgi:hypothetical protein